MARARLGVSAKIFLAYAALLLAFGGLSIFTVVSLHRGRQEIAASPHRLAVQREMEAAWRALAEYAGSREEARGGGPGVTSRIAASAGLGRARTSLADALGAIVGYLGTAPSAERRGEFEAYRARIAAVERELVEVAGALGGRGGAEPGAAAGEPDRRLLQLVSASDGVVHALRERGARVAAEMSVAESRAVNVALVMGGLGLLAAIGAALFMLRTLAPLQRLREHARQIAGGDYGRRTGIASRDEIGDLAREFDAMAGAIEEREHRLIRSERLATVGRMAAHITHEIRNPLASIGLNVELLGDDLGPADAEARRLVQAIGAELDRLSEITETYLRFVRLPRPKLERENLGAIVRDVTDFARGELESAGVRIEVTIAPQVPEVALDENQIRQALLNLVRNAREAMAGGGTLRVSVGVAQDGDVRVEVADSGAGIPPADLAKIFDPFFSTKAGGTGLGLALVQHIVAEHGGRIDVRAGAAGGTVFCLHFPVAAAPSPVGVTPASPIGDALPAAPAPSVPAAVPAAARRAG